MLSLICNSGVTQQCVDSALVRTLGIKDYAVCRVLLAYGALFPDSRQLFEAALQQQPPGFDFVELWLSAPKRPERSHAWNGMKKAAKAHSNETDLSVALATFIINIQPTPNEFYELLLAATRRYNLQNIAILSHGIRHSWQRAFSADKGSAAITSAVNDTNDERRYKILDFLLSAGAEPNTRELRKQLLSDVRNTRLDHVKLLVKHGVAPHFSEADSLGETIKSLRLDLFTILMGASIPSNVLPGAVDLIPESTGEEQRLLIVKSLSRKGPLEDALARQLLWAVRQSQLKLVNCCIQLHASVDYRDGSANCISIAAGRADLDLVQRLCALDPASDTTSRAVPKAYEAWQGSNYTNVVKTVTLLVECGARGPHIHNTILEAITRDEALQVLKALLVPGLEGPPAAAAVDKAVKLGRTDPLRLICQNSTIPKEALAEALDYVLAAPVFSKEKMIVLLVATRPHKDILEKELSSERLEKHSQRQEIIRLLLDAGAEVDAGGGAVIQYAIARGDLSATEGLLQRQPSIASLAAGLVRALAVRPLGASYALIERLLQVKTTGTGIGKSQALIHVTQELRNGTDDRKLLELLLRNNASVDRSNGEALNNAVAARSVPVVELLMSSKPSPRSIARAFTTARKIDDQSSAKYPIYELLLIAGVDEGQASEALIERVRKDSLDLALPKLLLKHGANVNERDGEALRITIAAKSLTLAETLSAPTLTRTAATAAFEKIRHVHMDSVMRLQFYELLLYKDVKEDERRAALISSVKLLDFTLAATLCTPSLNEASITRAFSVVIEGGMEPSMRFKFYKLLLDKGVAPKEHDIALKSAIKAGSFPLTELLLAYPLSPSSATSAFSTARKAKLDTSLRYRIYALLLEKNIAQDEIDNALRKACASTSRHHPTISLLLQKGASIDSERGEALFNAVSQGDMSFFQLLLQGNHPANSTISRGFEKAISLAKHQRFPIAKTLLTLGVDANLRSRLLIDVVKDDDDELVGLLLQPGNIAWDVANGCLLHAVRFGYLKIVELLIQHGVPHDTIVAAFEDLLQSGSVAGKFNGMEVTEALLRAGIPRDILNNTLAKVFQRALLQIPGSLVALLLKHGAEADTEKAVCFTVAAQKNDIGVFGQLAAREFNLNVVVWALIKASSEETEVLAWINICLEQPSKRGRIHETAMCLTMLTFPRGQTLLRLLLDQGCDPGFELESGDSQEKVTLLMWSLESDRMISDDAVLELLACEGQVKPSFVTITSAMSAMHMAASQGRIEVMRSLINLGADLDLRNSDGYTPLCLATSSRNMEAMMLLIGSGAPPNDGSLQIAARLPDLDAIRLLKESNHDVHWPCESFGGRPPLAELCFGGCGQGPIWERDIKDAMQLLLPLLDHQWKFDGKTILHLAIDNDSSSILLVRAFLNISQIWRSPSRNDDYLFIDSRSLCYSPTKYVELLCRSKPVGERTGLIELLKTVGRFDPPRFYAETGDQPSGSCGLPEPLAATMREERQAEWKKQQELRRQDEMAEHQDKKNEELNRRALQRLEKEAEEEMRLNQRKAQLQRAEDKKKFELIREHHERLEAQQLEAAQRQADQNIAQELRRQNAMQQSQMQHLAERQRLEAAHETSLHEQKLQTQGRALMLESSHMERRQEQEHKHQARMMRMQIEMLEQQTNARRAITAPGYPESVD